MVVLLFVILAITLFGAATMGGVYVSTRGSRMAARNSLLWCARRRAEFHEVSATVRPQPADSSGLSYEFQHNVPISVRHALCDAGSWL